MSTNEIMEYENFLNSHSNRGKWQYINWNSLKSMFNANKEPVCLVAFQSKHGGGVDPYYGLAYEKYLYFIQSDRPRHDPEDFVENSGQSLLKLIGEKYAKEITDVIPKMAYTKNCFHFPVPATPPVVEGHLDINIGCTFEPSESSLAKIMEVEGSLKGLKTKAHGAYQSIVSSFTLDIGTGNGEIVRAGVKSSILTGDFNGEFTTRANVIPLPGGLVKVSAGSSYTGKQKLYLNDVEWTFEYTLEYEVSATVDKNKMKQAPERIRVPVRQPVSDRYGINVNRGNQDSWWDILLLPVRKL